MQTIDLIKEATEKNRQIKADLLALMEKCSGPKITKEKIKGELFKLYLQIK